MANKGGKTVLNRLRRYLRSPGEIAFRLRQETANYYLYRFPPHPALTAGSLPLPSPAAVAEALQGSPYAHEVSRLAKELLAGRLPLLGTSINLSSPIPWRRDPVHGQELGTTYFRSIPYLDFTRAGDHKFIWELNRHQHLVLLAQAWRLDPQPAYLEAIREQLASWRSANPFQCGMNWTSALEVAFRALSWIWLWHLCGQALPPADQAELLTALYQHGCHLEYNLSIYFSPNTHVLGEAVALHALGVLFPSWPRAARWRRIGGDEVDRQVQLQILSDGAHFELSSYYHVYALDFLLFHSLLAHGGPGPLTPQLRRMAHYLHAITQPDGAIPLFGDDDGGRFMHPYGCHRQYGRATLATAAVYLPDPSWPCSPVDLPEQAAWWLGPECLGKDNSGQPAGPEVFPDSGIIRLGDGVQTHVIFDAGGFGPFRAGHSHSDALQCLLWSDGEEVLIDPGTATYIADPELRDRFRSSAAHNTIRIDALDQATPAGPFAWDGRPAVTIGHATATTAEATCRFTGFTHRRRLQLTGDWLLITDHIDGPPGSDHHIEQFWHLHSPAQAGRLHLPPGESFLISEGGDYGWRSRALGHSEPATVARREWRGALPVVWHTAIALGPEKNRDFPAAAFAAESR